ncbi:NDUFA12-domain-containing protein [Lentinula lateritia]|uniref:NDUFA12-domain-containing protein n=1 Tax=Lentinula aff. lateritia TaxID=2804960 RepID=A0ACC1TLN8_9AGAR|nr:NDUFA12-domain-containing protein [Lentinula aff. lateritia]KAJ3857166.1 NDUFA12-domain-containing protein [Lentinula lateritia]
MASLHRTIRNMRRVGLREWWRQMQYIGDAKSGVHVGTDQFGNRYFENMNGDEEIPGRQRWVDFAQHEYHASQVPPEWHSWIHHIRKDPPTNDPVIKNLTPPWQTPWMENLTGTRGAFKTYNTVAPKINAWEPKTVPRGT